MAQITHFGHFLRNRSKFEILRYSIKFLKILSLLFPFLEVPETSCQFFVALAGPTVALLGAGGAGAVVTFHRAVLSLLPFVDDNVGNAEGFLCYFFVAEVMSLAAGVNIIHRVLAIISFATPVTISHQCEGRIDFNLVSTSARTQVKVHVHVLKYKYKFIYLSTCHVRSRGLQGKESHLSQ